VADGSSKELIFVNLTPLIPLSFKGEGEEILERGECTAVLLPLWSLFSLPL